MTDTPRPRVLLVDDEEAITATLAPFLERSGFEVHVAGDGLDALARYGTVAPDIVVSDVLMPRMDGRELVRRLREAESWTPVIMLTKVDESFERTAALEDGADDYLGKPFDPPELVARIRAVLRRTAGGGRPLTASSGLISGDLRLDRTGRRAVLGGSVVDLTPKAFGLLEYLMMHPGEVHTREHLLSVLWGFEFAVTTRAVDHRIAELRRVLRDEPQDPLFIETVTGEGYRFVGRVSPA
ncbi:response regulator transcription factor [Microbacterium gorillae]|uniref:response regulator transcription factor n=1 Tax=Microbacterium gorillae TaxID=1231063 RepID=UPI0005904B4E|nr:response regulator transcription factor [Microbacterium gorillae]